MMSFTTAHGHYHTNFKLDSDGEQLILSNEAGIIVDSISFPIS